MRFAQNLGLPFSSNNFSKDSNTLNNSLHQNFTYKKFHQKELYNDLVKYL